MIKKRFEGNTALLIATGPSINDVTYEKIIWAVKRGIYVITINNAYQKFNFTHIHVACNDNWWRYYLGNDPLLKNLTCFKWTRYKDIAEKYGIYYINSIEKTGLSRDPSLVHINNGSGPMAINIATLSGFKKIILLGHDMKFDENYNGRKKEVGSTPRHFFGEYPKEMQHWPSVKIGLSEPGVLDGLIEKYQLMIPDLEDLGVEVVNCTPGSALKCFRQSTLEEELNGRNPGSRT